jgi:hypothetical protein
MGSAQGKGVREGQAPLSKEGEKLSTPNEEAGNMEQEKEGQVRGDEEEPACTE